VDVALIVGVGRLFGVPFPTHWLAITVTLVLGAASFCALGVAVASLIRNSEAAPAVVQLVLFPLLFVSGTYMPIHSDVLNRVSGALPVRPFNQALLGPFAQHAGLDWKNLGVLLAWGAAGALIAIRRFRWAPRPDAAEPGIAGSVAWGLGPALGRAQRSVGDGHHGNRYQNPRPVDTQLAHAARRPHVGEELVEDLDDAVGVFGSQEQGVDHDGVA
jgi:ABC-2 family transporter protein